MSGVCGKHTDTQVTCIPLRFHPRTSRSEIKYNIQTNQLMRTHAQSGPSGSGSGRAQRAPQNLDRNTLEGMWQALLDGRLDVDTIDAQLLVCVCI